MNFSMQSMHIHHQLIDYVGILMGYVKQKEDPLFSSAQSKYLDTPDNIIFQIFERTCRTKISELFGPP